MGMVPLSHRGRLLHNAQKSMQIKEKLKSVPEAIRSIQIKESSERRKSFLCLMR